MEPTTIERIPTDLPPSLARFRGIYAPRKELALSALLRGETVTGAAEAAGVCRGTVHDWLRNDAEFAAEFQARREELWESCRRGLEARLCETVDVLGELLRDRNPFVRLGASRVLADVLAQRVPAGQVAPAPGDLNVPVVRRVLAETPS